MSKITAERRSEIVARLRAWLPRGSRIAAEVVTVAKSGMSATVSLYAAIRDDDSPQGARIVGLCGMYAELRGVTTDKHGNIRMYGCGYSRADFAVMRLSEAVWDGDSYVYTRD